MRVYQRWQQPTDAARTSVQTILPSDSISAAWLKKGEARAGGSTYFRRFTALGVALEEAFAEGRETCGDEASASVSADAERIFAKPFFCC